VGDAIDHVRKIPGVDHVGIGSDFDGISENVVGLEDVSTFLTLLRRAGAAGATRTWPSSRAGTCCGC
jgi:membrane dipeptidase